MENTETALDYKITGIINEDGTELNYPKNPLKEKWDKLYPPTKYGEPCSPILGYQDNGAPYMNYGCVLCTETRCQHSTRWKVPEEDKETWEQYLQDIKEYNRIHNPNLISNVEKYLKELIK